MQEAIIAKVPYEEISFCERLELDVTNYFFFTTLTVYVVHFSCM